MSLNEMFEIMYCIVCLNPVKNRVICYGYDFTAMMREIIAEQDCDIWMDKMAECESKVLELMSPIFEEYRKLCEALAEERKKKRGRRIRLRAFVAFVLVVYTLLIILAAYLH